MILVVLTAWVLCLVVLVTPDGPDRVAGLFLSPFGFGDPDVLPTRLVFRVAFALLSFLLVFHGLAQIFPDRFTGPDDRVT
ncbi:hypothetical protein FH609_005235 [Streptomyces sp. 3MP-14]|uniref:Uncharacterized protein n=1 Tax=Streptomyces mimosae TaxID=2586635 RepID=A0A5N6ANK8_9ACTN|nr:MULTISPECIES: hypothetical protein [Streptomyces]KAB8169702.1 hypothetical protein FH607_002915 [Streptomyces mimosae]KAB8178450.1 hypothetical protein FH609_005235 [Streptomyces sp. 3MP-14]